MDGVRSLLLRHEVKVVPAKTIANMKTLLISKRNITKRRGIRSKRRKWKESYSTSISLTLYRPFVQSYRRWSLLSTREHEIEWMKSKTMLFLFWARKFCNKCQKVTPNHPKTNSVSLIDVSRLWTICSTAIVWLEPKMQVSDWRSLCWSEL
jgi:hypothetical protein